MMSVCRFGCWQLRGGMGEAGPLLPFEIQEAGPLLIVCILPLSFVAPSQQYSYARLEVVVVQRAVECPSTWL